MRKLKMKKSIILLTTIILQILIFPSSFALDYSSPFLTCEILETEVKGEYQPDINTVLLLHFNEGDTNEFNKLHNANLQGGEWAKEGVYGYALVNSQGPVSLVKPLDFRKNRFTLEFWFMPLASDSDIIAFPYLGGMFLRSNKITIDLPIIYQVLENGVFLKKKTGEGPLLSPSRELEQGKWYHIAFTLANGCTALYVNGILEDEKCWEKGVVYHSTVKDNEIMNNVGLGGRGSDRSYLMKGIIDELRISDVPRNSFNVDYKTTDKRISVTDIDFVGKKPDSKFEVDLVCKKDEVKEGINYEEVRKDDKVNPEEDSKFGGGMLLGIFITLSFLIVIKIVRHASKEKASICSHCKTKFDMEDKFCPHCGEKRKRIKTTKQKV